MARMDVVILACLVPFALRGLWRGFVREVVSLAGLLLGAFLALTRGRALGTILETRFGLEPEAALFLAAAGLFLGAVVAGAILGRLARRGVRAVFLGAIDRVAGGALGLAQGVAVVGLVCLGLLRLTPHLPIAREIDRSPVARPLVAVAEECIDAVRPWVAEVPRGGRST